MADSIREQILKRILTAMQTSPPASVKTITRQRGDSLGETDLPAISIVAFPENVQPVGGQYSGKLVDRNITVRLELWIANDAGKSAEETADPILQWCVAGMGVAKAAICADEDGNVPAGGVLAQLFYETSTEGESEQKLHEFMRGGVTYAVQFRTLANDLTKNS